MKAALNNKTPSEIIPSIDECLDFPSTNPYEKVKLHKTTENSIQSSANKEYKALIQEESFYSIQEPKLIKKKSSLEPQIAEENTEESYDKVRQII